MTSAEEHIKKIKEHLEEIDDAIEEGANNKPVTIGFNCSACAMQLLELYLHVVHKISIGKIIKHEWFKRPTAEQKKEPLIERKLQTEFPRKEEIYDLIYSLEEERNILVYGKPSEQQTKKVLELFVKLKEIFIKLLAEQNVKI
jgi:hypothetical protein